MKRLTNLRYFERVENRMLKFHKFRWRCREYITGWGIPFPSNDHDAREGGIESMKSGYIHNSDRFSISSHSREVPRRVRRPRLQ